MYSKVLLEHFEHPRLGEFAAFDSEPHLHGESINEGCGDRVEFRITYRETDAPGTECDVRVAARVLGCGVSIAATSLLCELIRAGLHTACTITPEEFLERFAPLPDGKQGCILVALNAFRTIQFS